MKETKPRGRRGHEACVRNQQKKEVFVVLLFTFGILCLLAYTGLAGTAGAYLDSAMRALFGIMRPAAALASILIGLCILVKAPPRIFLHGGILLSLVVLTGFSYHLTAGHGRPNEGGALGSLVASPLIQLFSLWGAGVILASFAVIALILLFEAPLSWAFAPGGACVRLIERLFGPKTQETLADEEQSVTPEPVREPLVSGVEQDEASSTESESDESPHTDEEQPRESMPPRVFAPALTSDTQPPLTGGPEKYPDYALPTTLLSQSSNKAASRDIKVAAEQIRKTLENFNISVEVCEVRVGPTVTQFALKPADGVKLASIVSLHNDLALALAAHPLRIEAPIPGKPYVGIEVPNQKVATVALRDLLESDIYAKRPNNLQLSLGKDVSGTACFADLTKTPHILVAGSTGSGKSVCLNSIILSLLYENSPADLKLIMVDPKKVEFTVYNGIPHLIAPVITDTKKTINALRWAINEMDARFTTLSQAGCRDIKTYRAGGGDMPYIVFIIDELADLMATSSSEVEAAIIRLSQMARAVGIHLIVATQRPSVDVITGLIKANITSRMAFTVASSTDSRTILDTVGAEKLMGRGDMLFVTPELGKPKRIQGCFVSDDDIKTVTDYLRDTLSAPEYRDDVTDKQVGGAAGAVMGGSDEGDPMLPEALDIIRESGKASASLLQRRLKLGYSRAARILDMLEEQGYIGPAQGAKPREVLIDPADHATIDAP